MVDLDPAGKVYVGQIVTLIQQPPSCVLANRTKLLLPRLLFTRLSAGDQIAFPPPGPDAPSTEAIVNKRHSAGAGTSLYLAAIDFVTAPKLDKRSESFVSASVRDGGLGISSVFIPCNALSAYFYALERRNGSDSARLYEALGIQLDASPAELRVAFKLRKLELETAGASRAEQLKLERAFNILGYPELRAHYDGLLADPEIPAVFPYGGAGSLLLSGERSRSVDIFFARQILAFVPERSDRRFHIRLRDCEFYSDKALCRDPRRKLQFWLDPSLAQFSWDPSWNRWKHLLSAKIEINGTFVRTPKYDKREGDWNLAWETALPSRLSIKVPTDFQQDIERARNIYCRFGQHSRALDQIRLCLNHKAIERKDLERMCSELGIPPDFDIAQINWRPDYDPFFYRELFVSVLERTIYSETNTSSNLKTAW